MEEFISYLRLELNRSSLTAQSYQRDIQQFADWLGCAPAELVRPQAVKPNDIRAWLSALAQQGCAAASLRRKTQSLRALFRWAMKTKRISSNPAAQITLAKLPRHLPDIVKAAEVETILENLPCHQFRTARLHLAVNMIYSLGLRQAELLSLTDANIRQTSDGCELRVTGKGRKERIIPIPASLMDEINRWQTLRDAELPDLAAPRPLIAGRRGHIAKDTLYKWIHQLLNSTSASHKSPHTLRHTFATEMISNGANLDAVRELLGHNSLSTTQIYTHLSATQLKAAYSTAHPRAKKNED